MARDTLIVVNAATLIRHVHNGLIDNARTGLPATTELPSLKRRASLVCLGKALMIVKTGVSK